jgi:hypothetical protein
MKINLSEEDFRPLDIYEQWAELRRSKLIPYMRIFTLQFS